MCILVNQGTTIKRIWTVSGTESEFPLIGATAKIALASSNGQMLFTQDLIVIPDSRIISLLIPSNVSSDWPLASCGSSQFGSETQEDGSVKNNYGKYLSYQIEITHANTEKSVLDVAEPYFIVIPEILK